MAPPASFSLDTLTTEFASRYMTLVAWASARLSWRPDATAALMTRTTPATTTTSPGAATSTMPSPTHSTSSVRGTRPASSPSFASSSCCWTRSFCTSTVVAVPLFNSNCRDLHSPPSQRVGGRYSPRVNRTRIASASSAWPKPHFAHEKRAAVTSGLMGPTRVTVARTDTKWSTVSDRSAASDVSGETARRRNSVGGSAPGGTVRARSAATPSWRRTRSGCAASISHAS
mmetsp:Transcript_27387/g.81905  ORF Transcript_27387/g.81905 Transcript_27387/m.81905 type:complete len:229 (-) Transcript_27387:281-967(-)